MAKRLKIAYLTTKYPSVSHTFIRREILEIERRGYDIFRIAIRPSNSALVNHIDREEFGKTICCLKLPVWKHIISFLRTVLTHPIRFVDTLKLTFAMGSKGKCGYLKHLAYLIEACTILNIIKKNKIDHVHVHFGTNPATVARMIYKLGGPSYSFTVHGPTEFDSSLSLDLKGKIKDAIFIIAISDFCLSQLYRWSDPLDWKKIHVVHCTVGEEFFNAITPIKNNNKTFVCIGRLAPQKGQLTLVEAFSQLVKDGNDANLVFVGDGEFRDLITEKISLYGLKERIKITGFVSESDVRDYIASSRALVLPSFAEGLPMVIMEAFAVGRPVVATYIAGIPELVKPNVNGWLVPAGNVALLKAALLEVLIMPTGSLSKMAVNGNKLTYQRHHTITEGRHLASLFDRYLATSISSQDRK